MATRTGIISEISRFILSVLPFQQEENVGSICFCLLGNADIFSEVSSTKQTHDSFLIGLNNNNNGSFSVIVFDLFCFHLIKFVI